MPTIVEETGYTGRDNLEVMREAENYNRWLCDLVTSRAQRHHRLLDFGAGSGTFARFFKAQGFDIGCVEPDETLRRALMSEGLQTVPSIDLLPPGSVDFIYTLNVLEHIEDDASAARQLAHALRAGGTLLVYVPAFQVLFSSMDEKVGHYRRYRLRSLVRLIRASGLRVTYARYGDCLGFAATLAYKMIGSGDGTITPSQVRFYDRAIFPVSRCLDHVAGYVVGKNAMVVATKP